MALSEGDFAECVDKSPPNDSCTAAIPVTIDEVVATSTQHIFEPQYDSCLSETVEGTWFTFVGTGDFLQVSPCNLALNAATRITVQKGSCDALECVVAIQFVCQTLVWYAEAGVKYSVHISTDQSHISDSDLPTHDLQLQYILNGTVAPSSALSEEPTAVPLTDEPSTFPSRVSSVAPVNQVSEAPSHTSAVPSRAPGVAPITDLDTSSAVPTVAQESPTTEIPSTNAPTSWAMQSAATCYAFIVSFSAAMCFAFYC